MIEFLIGVDGGGPRRARLARRDGTVLGRGRAGPSALGQGIEPAWREIEHAVGESFRAAGLSVPPWQRCALGAGLSGVSNRPWRDEFVVRNIGFGRLEVDTDGFTMLLGAHGGLPLAICGSVGQRLASRLSPAARSRCVDAKAGPTAGTLTLIRRSFDMHR